MQETAVPVFMLKLMLIINEKWCIITVTSQRRIVLGGKCMAIFWLILFAIFLVVELFTMGLTTIWFAGGALITALIAWIGGPVWLQIVIFIVCSVLLLIFTRPIAVKYFNKSRTRTNADRAIGEHAVVTEKIDNLNGTGRASINGVDWRSRSQKDEIQFEIGQTVTVEKIEGVTAIVK